MKRFELKVTYICYTTAKDKDEAIRNFVSDFYRATPETKKEVHALKIKELSF